MQTRKQTEPASPGHFRTLTPFLLMAILFVMSGGPQPEVPVPVFPHFDKLAHFLVFGLLATTWLRFRPRRALDWKQGVFAAGATILFGLADELHQFTNPCRHFEWADWFADSLGALVAVVAYQRWTAYRLLLEWRCFAFGTK